jgi:hypothetical protein
MSDMVEKLYANYNKRVAKKEDKKKVKEEDTTSMNRGIGEDPPEPPTPYSISSSFSSSSHSHHYKHSHHSSFHPSTSKKPLLKLDVKFNLSMFNAEANAYKINNWIIQIKVYCHVQKIEDEQVKIHFTFRWMEGTILVWWERKFQKGSKHNSKILYSWSKFTSPLKKKFYPLGYVKKSMMEWKNLR